MLRSSLLTTALVSLVTAGASLTTLTPSVLADTGAPQATPTFAVLHDDHIGQLSLPAGSYTLTPFGSLTAAQATTRFAAFLQDFDGKLPAPWTVNPATATFTRGLSGFQVTPAAPNPPAPSGTTTGRACPGMFVVEHNDRIAGLAFPAGSYAVTSLRSSCRDNMAVFARLLARPNGPLPAPWQLDAQTGTFSTTVGARFRVKLSQGAGA